MKMRGLLGTGNRGGGTTFHRHLYSSQDEKDFTEDLPLSEDFSLPAHLVAAFWSDWFLVNSFHHCHKSTEWNEKTSTLLYVLEGGFTRFAQEFPNLVVTSSVSGSLNIQNDKTRTLTDILNRPEDSASVEMEKVKEFLCYLKDLDEKIAALRTLRTLKAKLVALEDLEQALNKELTKEEEKLTQILENSIPDGCQCPICFRVFVGEIFSCKNGHSVCSNCYGGLTTCPFCREIYVIDLRNRAMENLLGNLMAECACGLKLELKEMESHVKTCAKKSEIGMEITKLKKDLDATKLRIDEINKKLGKICRIIVDKELLGYSKLNKDPEMNPLVWKKLCDYMSAKESTISSLQQSLLSMVSS